MKTKAHGGPRLGLGHVMNEGHDPNACLYCKGFEDGAMSFIETNKTCTQLAKQRDALLEACEAALAHWEMAGSPAGDKLRAAIEALEADT